MVALQREAPPNAIGYRLVELLDDGSEIAYPRGNRKPWRSSSGRLTWRRCFRLWPFEIPAVERRAIYGVAFFAALAPLPTPDTLLDGLLVEPLRLEGDE